MVHNLNDNFTIVVTGSKSQYCGITCPYLRRFNALCFLYNKQLEHTTTKIIRSQRCASHSHQPHIEQLSITNQPNA